MKNRILLSSAVLSFALTSLGALPEVQNLEVRQNWPFSEKVCIDFTLSGGDRSDVVVTATWEGQTTPVELKTYYNVGAGVSYSLELSLADCGIGSSVVGFKVKVETCALADRMYLVIDLPTRTKSFLAESAVDETTFANDTYRSTKMAFRRVLAYQEAGGQITYVAGYNSTIQNLALPKPDGTTGTLGSRGRAAWQTLKFSSDYFIAVMPLTRAHHDLLLNSSATPSDKTCYLTQSYNTLRGKWSEGVDVRTTGFRVKSTSRFATYRAALTDVLRGCILDLPTCAQLEIAHMAGEGDDHIFSLCPELKSRGFSSITASTTRTQMTNLVNEIAIWSNNFKNYYDSTLKGYKPAQRAPNAWYLFDCAGIQHQATLDEKSNGSGTDISSFAVITSDSQNRSCMGGTTDTVIVPIRGLVPCEYYGLAMDSASAGIRLTINTSDWLKQGVDNL